MSRCSAHRPRRRRLLRLPSARPIASAAAATLAVGVPTALLGPVWLAPAVLLAGATVSGGYLRRHRTRVALELRMARSLIRSGGCACEVVVPGLTADVRAQTTSDGVARIQAGCWLDAIRALGYAMGRDRGFQLELLRRTATGRLAQVWGRTALPLDRAHRPLGLATAAATAATALETPERDLLTAFAAGVNAAWDQHGPPFECRFLSYRPDPWAVEDSLAISLLMFHALSWTEQAKRADAVIRRAFPADVADFFLPGPGDPPLPAGLSQWRGCGGAGQSDDADDMVPVDRVAAGSNCWVAAGPDGPVLACDPHLGLSLPGPLYEVDLRWPGARLRGLAAAGLPVVLTGGNGHLVWGVTDLSADVLDLVPVDPARVATRTERIRVRGGTDVLLETARQDGMPVAAQPLPDGPVAIRWTGHDRRSADLRFQRLAQARSVGEAVTILDDAQGVALNVLLADTAGRMAQLATGLLPRRPAQGGGPAQGYLAGRERPRLLDPPSGLLVSANDAALPEDTFRIGYDVDPGHRARRLRARLIELPATAEAMRALQHDLAAELYVPYRALAVDAVTGRDDATAALLAAWDGTADAGSRAFGLLVGLRKVLATRVLSPLLSRCRTLDPGFRYAYRSVDRPLLAIIRSGDLALLPRDAEAASWPAFVADCVGRALADLGPGTPTWGQINAVGLDHPFAELAPWSAGLLGVAPRPQAGALHTVRTCVPGFAAAGRAVISPGAAGFAAFDLPGGQSGHPLNPHYTDRHDAWARVVVPRTECPSAVECTQVLRPAMAAGEEPA